MPFADGHPPVSGQQPSPVSACEPGRLLTLTRKDGLLTIDLRHFKGHPYISVTVWDAFGRRSRSVAIASASLGSRPTASRRTIRPRSSIRRWCRPGKGRRGSSE
jgi:hypothetical protein